MIAYWLTDEDDYPYLVTENEFFQNVDNLNMKYARNHPDYILGIYSYRDGYEDINKIPPLWYIVSVNYALPIKIAKTFNTWAEAREVFEKLTQI